MAKLDLKNFPSCVKIVFPVKQEFHLKEDKYYTEDEYMEEEDDEDDDDDEDDSSVEKGSKRRIKGRKMEPRMKMRRIYRITHSRERQRGEALHTTSNCVIHTV